MPGGEVSFKSNKNFSGENVWVDSALSKQEGGSHYKDYAIQPIEFIHKNNVPYCEANVIKYIMRHKKKNGKEDLLKAKHYLEMLIEMEYGTEVSKGI
jgi:hypothetical protein